jgi:subtilase family serine protease
VSVPDLTGQWTAVTETCTDTTKGSKCAIKGTFFVQNIGEGDAESAFVKYYLSEDNVFDGGDTFLSSASVGKIIAGTVIPKTFNRSFAAGASSGKYIIAVVDADNTVAESNENNNNIAYGPLQ